MTNQTVIKFDMKGLEELRKQLGDAYYTRVGILGAHAARNGETKESINNATLGLIMMFGSLSKNIPARDFLITPLMRQKREFIEALQTSSMQVAIMSGDIKRAYGILGAVAERLVDVAFQTSGFGQWPPNAPATVRIKKSDKPLIDTGQLRRAITSDVVKK